MQQKHAKTKLMDNVNDCPLQLAQTKAYEENVKKNGGAMSFKRGKDTPAPNHMMKSTKEPHVGPRKRLPN